MLPPHKTDPEDDDIYLQKVSGKPKDFARISAQWPSKYGKWWARVHKAKGRKKSK